MARKRKRVVTKVVTDIKAKGERSAPAPPPPQAPKKPEPFPVKALIKVFHNLDIITATSFRLASHEFETIYQEHFAEVFKGYNLLQPLSLELRIQYANGTGYFLKDCLKSWMPAHLVYDDYGKKFVTVDNLGKAFLKDIGAWEEARDASRTWRKTMNERKKLLVEDKRKFFEELGLDTSTMDFSWEMQAMGVESMDLEPESDNDEEASRLMAPRGGVQIVEPRSSFLNNEDEKQAFTPSVKVLRTSPKPGDDQAGKPVANRGRVRPPKRRQAPPIKLTSTS